MGVEEEEGWSLGKGKAGEVAVGGQRGLRREVEAAAGDERRGEAPEDRE